MAGEADKAAGMCKEAVMKVDPTLGLVLFILNIVFSGLGTIINAFVGEKFNVTTLIFGILQCCFVWTIVPWIWSIIFGYWIWQRANGKM